VGYVMFLATALLLFPLPQAVITSNGVAETVAAVHEGAKDSSKPDAPLAPEPKIKSDGDGGSRLPSVNASVISASNELAAAGAIPPRAAGGPAPLLKPLVTETYETPRKKKIWYTLGAVSHGAAAFDAWSTRRAVSGNYGTEANPLLRPFAHSGSIYAATQISPALMDFLGRRMMTSRHGWIRKMWWLPQTAGASVSFSAGVHNMNVVP